MDGHGPSQDNKQQPSSSQLMGAQQLKPASWVKVGRKDIVGDRREPGGERKGWGASHMMG